MPLLRSHVRRCQSSPTKARRQALQISGIKDWQNVRKVRAAYEPLFSAASILLSPQYFYRSRHLQQCATISKLAVISLPCEVVILFPGGVSYAVEDGCIDDGGLERADRPWYISSGRPCAL